MGSFTEVGKWGMPPVTIVPLVLWLYFCVSLLIRLLLCDLGLNQGIIFSQLLLTVLEILDIGH